MTVDAVYTAGAALRPDLTACDWPVQRCTAAAAWQTRQLLARGGTQATVRAAARLLDPTPLTGDDIAHLDRLTRAYGDRTIGRDLAGRHWPVTAGAALIAARQRDLGKTLARIDQRLADKLFAAAVTTMRDALQRAGVKARVRARKRATSAQAALEVDGMTDAVLAAISVTADELLDRAFLSYGADAQQWIAEANARRRKAIARAWDLDELDIDDHDEDNRAAGAAAILVALLLGAARGALSSTSPAVEPKVDLPFSMVRTAMRVRDGAPVVPGPKGLSTLPVVGPDPVQRMVKQAAERATPLPDLQALARGEALPVDLSGVVPTLVRHYEWVHGYFGEPGTPFPPHLALDGATYTDDTRGLVLAKDPGDWPEGAMVWSVDDHDSCTCYEIVTWEPMGAGDGPPDDSDSTADV